AELLSGRGIGRSRHRLGGRRGEREPLRGRQASEALAEGEEPRGRDAVPFEVEQYAAEGDARRPPRPPAQARPQPTEGRERLPADEQALPPIRQVDRERAGFAPVERGG